MVSASDTDSGRHGTSEEESEGSDDLEEDSTFRLSQTEQPVPPQETPTTQTVSLASVPRGHRGMPKGGAGKTG